LPNALATPTARLAKMRAYTAFVPNLVMERIALDPGGDAVAYEAAFPAALLFVDIVGFVKLTGVTHLGVVQRERRGTMMERLQNKGGSGGRLDTEDGLGIAGLTGRGAVDRGWCDRARAFASHTFSTRLGREDKSLPRIW